MSASDVTMQRDYDVHGVRLHVIASDARALDAMDLRLRDFRVEQVAGRAPGPHMRLEFAIGDPDGSEPAPTTETGRPIYDTPYGTLEYLPGADVVRGALAGVLLRCEPALGRARITSRSFASRDLYFATHPLATISLMELMERRERYSLHAACLATEDGRGVLLSGTSGAGKSTLSLALARAGMGFLSDDVVFLAQRGGEPAVTVLGFADTVGLTPYAAEQFTELRDCLAQPPQDGFPKRLGRIEELFGSSGVSKAVPSAVVFPEIVRAEPSVIEPLDAGDALLRLVPDVLITQAASTQAHLGAIAALLAQCRCYTLRSGPDLEQSAELVRAIV